MDITGPEVDAGPDIVVGQHTPVTLDGANTTDNFGIDNMTWQLVYAGVPIELYGPTPTFTFDRVGIYIVNLVAIDLAGNRGTDTMRVTVRDTTPPTADAGTDVTIDQRSSVSLDGSRSTDNVRIANWRWTIIHGDEETTFEGSVTSFTFVQVGVYLITLNVTDVAGNWDTDSFRVTVRDTTDPVADAGEDIFVDQGVRVSFDGTNSSDNVVLVSWSWSFRVGGESVTLTGPTANHTFERVGTYLVELRVVDGSGLTGFADMRVHVLDGQPPQAVTDGPHRILEGEVAFLNATGSWDNVGIEGLTWSFNYNQVTVKLNGISMSHRFELKGNYTITLTVTDTSGNKATATTWVLVERPAVPGDGPMEDVPIMLWVIIVLAVVLVTIITILLFVKSARSKRDLGWAPTVEERAVKEGPTLPEDDADEDALEEFEDEE